MRDAAIEAIKNTVHLRIVAPEKGARRALELLKASKSVSSVVLLEGAARKPKGDVIECVVARKDASVLIQDLRELKIQETGSISIEPVGTLINNAAEAAEDHAPGLASDAVVWEEVENRNEELTELSATFLAFMVLAMLIAAVGIGLDQPILIVGAMVVGGSSVRWPVFPWHWWKGGRPWRGDRFRPSRWDFPLDRRDSGGDPHLRRGGPRSRRSSTPWTIR